MSRSRASPTAPATPCSPRSGPTESSRRRPLLLELVDLGQLWRHDVQRVLPDEPVQQDPSVLLPGRRPATLMSPRPAASTPVGPTSASADGSVKFLKTRSVVADSEHRWPDQRAGRLRRPHRKVATPSAYRATGPPTTSSTPRACR